MNETRPYASLSGSLLARKGGAKPAMRPRPLSNEGMLDDLGWDDFGGDEPGDAGSHVPSSIAGLTPAPKLVTPREEPAPVHVQQRTLAENFGEPEPVVEQQVLPEAVVTPLRSPSAKPQALKRPRAAAAAGGRKAAFTLRLDADRHLRLRLATALTRQSAQQLVTTALDQFLETMPELGSLVQRLPSRSGKNS